MSKTIAEQLKTLGVSSPSSSSAIQQFDLWTMSDKNVNFPEERLGQKRPHHPKRFVIVLQNNKDNENPLIRIVLIAPLSTSAQHQRLDYLLRRVDHQCLPNDSYIRIRHIQPILKKDLTTRWGNISQDSIRDDIKDRLFMLYDL